MKNVNVHHKMKNVNVHHYLFLSETYEPVARGTCRKAEIFHTRPTFALLPLRCPLSTKSEDYLSVWGCRW